MDNNTMTKEEREALRMVLGFVGRWNKNDKEKEIAEATSLLERKILSTKKENKFESFDDIFNNIPTKKRAFFGGVFVGAFITFIILMSF